MQLNARNLLRRRDTTVASKRDIMHPRAELSVDKRLSDDPALGDPATGGSLDGGNHRPLTVAESPTTIPTTTTESGTATILPPIVTGVPISSTGTSDGPLTTPTFSAAPRSASTASPTTAAGSALPSSSSSSLHTSTSGSFGQATVTNSTGRGGSKMTAGPLSRGAVAGIVMVVLSVLLVIGVLVYRKWAIKRRSRIRQTWLPRPFVVETTTTTMVETDAPGALEKGAEKTGEAASGGSGANGTNGATPGPPLGTTRTIPRVKPPPVSLLSIPGLLSAVPDAAGSQRTNVPTGRRLSSMPDLAAAAAQDGLNSGNSLLLSQTYSALPAGRADPGALAKIGVVRCIFEPSMPDELRIRVGEAMRIIAEYDDGWGLCENLRSERGVVPLQCLDRGMGEGGGTSESSQPPSGRRTAPGL